MEIRTSQGIDGLLLTVLQKIQCLRRFTICDEANIVESCPNEVLLPTILTYLQFEDFQKLKSLDRKGLQHLTAFEELWIRHCPKLECMLEDRLPACLPLYFKDPQLSFVGEKVGKKRRRRMGQDCSRSQQICYFRQTDWMSYNSFYRKVLSFSASYNLSIYRFYFNFSSLLPSDETQCLVLFFILPFSTFKNSVLIWIHFSNLTHPKSEKN